MCKFCEDQENFQDPTKERKWHDRYVDLAGHVAQWSKDPSSKIGAVVIGEHGQILSTGYNGFPRGVEDSTERLNDRELKYKYVIHAEMNVIYNASLSGISLKGSTLYVHGLPMCSSCALGVIQSGIAHVVIRKTDINKAEKWRESWDTADFLLREANVRITIL